MGEHMIIAQLTDIHIGFVDEHKVCQNTPRLKLVIEELNGMVLRPDLVLLTGDLVESGEAWAYDILREGLKALDIPTYFALGNHDNREVFAKCFPDVPMNDGFVQYVIEDKPLRIIVLDSLEEERHGGAFCEARQAWLDKTLAQAPDRPTMIAIHHPPIETGIAWMTAQPRDPWVHRFRDVIKKYDNIVHIISGHIHRTIYQRLENTTISVCEAVAPEVKLELAAIDVNLPDGRELIRESVPRYSLHHWNGSQLTSHSSGVNLSRVLIRFDDDHQSIVKKIMGSS